MLIKYTTMFRKLLLLLSSGKVILKHIHLCPLHTDYPWT